MHFSLALWGESDWALVSPVQPSHTVFCGLKGGKGHKSLRISADPRKEAPSILGQHSTNSQLPRSAAFENKETGDQQVARAHRVGLDMALFSFITQIGRQAHIKLINHRRDQNNHSLGVDTDHENGPDLHGDCNTHKHRNSNTVST